MSERRRPRGRTVPPVSIATEVDSDIAYQDRAWFDAHPGEEMFVRPARPYELQQYSLPPGSICRVVRIDSYRQFRAFAPPQPAEVN